MGECREINGVVFLVGQAESDKVLNQCGARKDKEEGADTRIRAGATEEELCAVNVLMEAGKLGGAAAFGGM